MVSAGFANQSTENTGYWIYCIAMFFKLPFVNGMTEPRPVNVSWKYNAVMLMHFQIDILEKQI